MPVANNSSSGPARVFGLSVECGREKESFGRRRRRRQKRRNLISACLGIQRDHAEEEGRGRMWEKRVPRCKIAKHYK